MEEISGVYKKNNRKFVERSKIDTPNTPIYGYSLSGLIHALRYKVAGLIQIYEPNSTFFFLCLLYVVCVFWVQWCPASGTCSAHSLNPNAYFGHSWFYFDIQNLRLVILYIRYFIGIWISLYKDVIVGEIQIYEPNSTFFFLCLLYVVCVFWVQWCPAPVLLCFCFVSLRLSIDGVVFCFCYIFELLRLSVLCLLFIWFLTWFLCLLLSIVYQYFKVE
jgi:hypothetical protein